MSSFADLFAGLPVFGPGVVRGATIQALDALAGTITLSDPVGAAGTAVSFATGFLTTGRRVKPWSQVKAQPALYLRRIGTTDDYSGHLPICTLECEVWIYSQAGQDPDATPDTALSNLDNLVRQAFAPDDDGRFTLGRTVYWCRIEGRGDYSPGDLGGQGISRIPVRITLPAPTGFETVMSALFVQLQAAATIAFTANASAASAVLSNVAF
jgi:hypothetical protein